MFLNFAHDQTDGRSEVADSDSDSVASTSKTPTNSQFGEPVPGLAYHGFENKVYDLEGDSNRPPSQLVKNMTTAVPQTGEKTPEFKTFQHQTKL